MEGSSTNTCIESGAAETSHRMRSGILDKTSTEHDSVNSKHDFRSTPENYPQLNNQMNIHPVEESLTCEFCVKSFSCSSELKIHRRFHTNEKPFDCKVCSKRFAQKRYLKQHLASHEGREPYTCHICNTIFGRKDSLKAHLSVHEEEKPFLCDICSKGFTHKPNLRKHLHSHEGLEKFSCKICGNKYRRKYLRRHYQVHAKNSNISFEDYKTLHETVPIVDEFEGNHFKPIRVDTRISPSGDSLVQADTHSEVVLVPGIISPKTSDEIHENDNQSPNHKFDDSRFITLEDTPVDSMLSLSNETNVTRGHSTDIALGQSLDSEVTGNARDPVCRISDITHPLLDHSDGVGDELMLDVQNSIQTLGELPAEFHRLSPTDAQISEVCLVCGCGLRFSKIDDWYWRIESKQCGE